MTTTATSGTLIEELEQQLRRSVTEVFKTMLDLGVTPIDNPSAPAKSLGIPQLASSVGFIGQVTGVVYIYSTAALAKQLASKMLGMPEAELSEPDMVNDVMGELSNMIVGSVKSRLCDRGHTCTLTIPSIVRGSGLTVETVANTGSRTFSFVCNGSTIMLQILIKTA